MGSFILIVRSILPLIMRTLFLDLWHEMKMKYSSHVDRFMYCRYRLEYSDILVIVIVIVIEDDYAYTVVVLY